MIKGVGRLYLTAPRGTREHTNREDAPISLADIRKPWLLFTRTPRNRGNAGAGSKVRKFLKTVDQFFPGGAK